MTQNEKLVMMANQIASFFRAQGEARAVPQITRHIEAFWDPRMRRTILGHLDAGGAGLDPLALQALRMLTRTPHPEVPWTAGSDAG
jgi:formate dehydrogenase subunit delta